MITAADSVFGGASGVFTRKCTANEVGCCSLSEKEGMTHATFSADVKLLKNVSQGDLKAGIEKAMLRLRHLVPGVGCTLSKLAPGDGFQFRYEIPKSSDAARKWAASVTCVYEEPMSFEEAHNRAMDTIWWKASDGRFTHELHVYPNPAGPDAWTFILSTHHGNADGRTAWMCLEKIFAFLQDEVLGQAPSVEDLKWGEETRRLSAAPESVCSIAKNENGEPDEFPDVSGFTMPPSPEGYVPFLYPFETDGKVEDGLHLSRLIFTKEQTAKLHSLCKTRGTTVTQAVTALTNLANVEWALRVSSAKEDNFEGTVDNYDKASHFLTSNNAISARALLPKEYLTFDTEHSTPLNCVDGLPLSFPMVPYRKLLAINRNVRTVTPVGSVDIFWDELVKDVADAWTKVDRTLDPYRFRAALVTSMFSNPAFDSSSRLNSVAPWITSCGDMSRLNILEPFRPSANNETIVVQDLNFTTRFMTPAFVNCYLQYDDAFRVMSFTSRKCWTRSQVDLYIEVLRGWVEKLF